MEYIAKTKGKVVLANIVEVQDCDTYSKKYLIGFAYLGKVHYISTNKTGCREYASKKQIEVIYYSETGKFISKNANPVREIILASLIGIVGIALTIKGLTMPRKI